MRIIKIARSMHRYVSGKFNIVFESLTTGYRGWQLLDSQSTQTHPIE